MFSRSQYSVYSTQDGLKCHHCCRENKVLHPNLLEATSVRNESLLLAQVVNIHGHPLHSTLSLAPVWLCVIINGNVLVMGISSQD